MKYISFDIECCDGKHICEFGYVVTDENFRILEKECFTINPNAPFNLVGRENRADLILFFSEETYYKSSEFSAFYGKIKDLLSTSDSIIFGYAIKNDAAFLRDACKRYKLSPINFNFVDSQSLYKEFSGEKDYISLENAATILKLAQPQFHHKSDEDALLAIELVEKICEQLNVKVQELIALYPSARGKSYNFNIQYTSNDLQSMLKALDENPNTLSQNKKKTCVREFSKKVRSQRKIVDNCLNGKKICFSTFFEKNYTRETIKLIQVLANYGCEYNMKVSENDYYVASDEELTNIQPEKNTRYEVALRNEDGRNVKVLSFADFLKMINMTAGALETLKMPTVEKEKNGQRGVHSTGKVSNTLGDQLRAKGIDITQLFNE